MVAAAVVATTVAVGAAEGVNDANAAKSAASMQAGYGESANQAQRDQYQQTRDDLTANDQRNVTNYTPFLNTGTSANNQLGYLMGFGGTDQSNGMSGAAGSLAKPFTMADYQADPGYAFRLSEGQKALDRANAAKGKYFSGEAIKGLTDYNQQSASQEYQNAFDRYNTNQSNLYSRLAGLSNSGQTAANGIALSGANTQAQLNNAGQNMVNNISGTYKDIGNARAAGIIGNAQGWDTGLDAVGKGASMIGGMM